MVCLPVYLQAGIVVIQALMVFFILNNESFGTRILHTATSSLFGLLILYAIYYLCNNNCIAGAYIVFAIPIIYGLMTLFSLMIFLYSVNRVNPPPTIPPRF